MSFHTIVGSFVRQFANNRLWKTAMSTPRVPSAKGKSREN